MSYIRIKTLKNNGKKAGNMNYKRFTNPENFKLYC